MMSSIHQGSHGAQTRGKSGADTDLPAAVGEKVVVEPASPPELLVPIGVADPQGSFQIMLDPNESTLFLKALKDGAVTNEELSGLPLAEMAKPGAQYIDSGMTANTMVLAQQTGTLELPFHWGAC